MTEEKNKNISDFAILLDKDTFKAPKPGDIVNCVVLSASRAEVKLDIDGIKTGIVRGPELYIEAPEYANLKPGDEVEATVIEEENENGDIELSFRYAGEEKAWQMLKESFEEKKPVKVKIIGANRGGLMVTFGQIAGFMPVSQLSPEKYPRISGGDRSKILEKLKSYVGEEVSAMVANFSEDRAEEKIIFSEKDAWSEQRKDVLDLYKVGTAVEGKITAVADFGVFVSFGDKLEGLIHISELAWQRIDNPADLYNVGDKIKAEVIDVKGSKIFLSAKKLLSDPWEGAAKKYKSGQTVKGKILKVNPFGLFVKLDDEIHGLAHVSQIGLAPDQKIYDIFKVGDSKDFVVTSVEPKEHRLGLEITVGKEKNIEKSEKKEIVKSKAKKEEDVEKDIEKEKKKEKKSKK